MPEPIRPSAIELEILRHLRELRFGSLEVTVHEQRIVQIERRERWRPDPHPPPAR